MVPNIQTVNIGSNASSRVTTINIGGGGDIVNISGVFKLYTII